MQVLFHDTKTSRTTRKIKKNRIPGAQFDEPLYADDTILIPTDTRSVNLFINALGTEAEKI